MSKEKPSGVAIFMYCVIFLCAVTAGVCFFLHYGNVSNSDAVLWVGIVTFMIVYHLWLRLIMGNVSKLFNISYKSGWFAEKPFEKHIYKFLRVKKWKDKALTYNPESFSLKKYSLEDIANTMSKSETDHWINEIISVTSILFSLLWGAFPVFLLTAVAAMIFDMQFIVIQRYNRPRIVRIMEKMNKKKHMAISI